MRNPNQITKMQMILLLAISMICLSLYLELLVSIDIIYRDIISCIEGVVLGYFLMSNVRDRKERVQRMQFSPISGLFLLVGVQIITLTLFKEPQLRKGIKLDEFNLLYIVDGVVIVLLESLIFMSIWVIYIKYIEIRQNKS